MLYLPRSPGAFNLWLSSHATTRPAAAFGATVTPGNNTKGSWATVMTGASVTEDCYGIAININSIATSAAAKDSIYDIGIDPAGGTSFTVLVPDLLCSSAGAFNAASLWFYFPIWIKAGSTIGARGSINNATVGTGRVNVKLACRPAFPSLVKVGSNVQAIGISSGTSSGTAIVPGTTSEGSWTSIGSLTAGLPDAWWFQIGMGANDSTMTAAAVAYDVAADSSGSQILVQDAVFTVTSAEAIANQPVFDAASRGIAAGTTIYARAQSSNTVDSNVSCAIYAVT